jgi:hypothetical protein
VAGHPEPQGSSAAALLTYDVGHSVPWDWRVSLYTWTKAIAVGAYLAPLMLVLAGVLGSSSSLWLWAAPTVALALLAATGVILIADLEQPQRFHYLLLRPQWRSWLVRGALIITAYGAVLVTHLVLSAAGAVDPQKWLAIVGAPLAVAAAVYTAYLFAQAKARDLWQSQLLAPHMLVQALIAGAAVMVPLAHWLAPGVAASLEWILMGSVAAHLLLTGVELRPAHGTDHANLAVRELRTGRFAPFLWLSVALAGAALFAPIIGIAGAGCALVAVLVYEHAYVQAGQAVPLA